MLRDRRVADRRRRMLLLEGHKGTVHTLAFSPDGQTLASVAGHANVIWLWDLARGRPSTGGEHARRVVALAFAPDGGTLACADSAGNVTLWDLTSRKERSLGGVTQALYLPCRLAYSPDGRLLAATGVPSDWVSRT